MVARQLDRPGSVMGLTLSVHPGYRSTIVRVGGEIDIGVADPLQEGLLRIMREHTARLLLDLSGVSFMDCAGVQALALTRRRAELRGGSMDLIAASSAARRIINLTGQRDVFPIHDPGQGHGDGWRNVPVGWGWLAQRTP
jgi:anti-anti-sigma factor